MAGAVLGAPGCPLRGNASWTCNWGSLWRRLKFRAQELLRIIMDVPPNWESLQMARERSQTLQVRQSSLWLAWSEQKSSCLRYEIINLILTPEIVPNRNCYLVFVSVPVRRSPATEVSSLETFLPQL